MQKNRSSLTDNNTELVRLLTAQIDDGGYGTLETFPENPTALECLDQALTLFRQAEESTDWNISFNIGKCLYEKCCYLMDSYGLDSDQPPVSRKVYFLSI